MKLLAQKINPLWTALGVVILFLPACTKWVETPAPNSQTSSAEVFSTDQGANAAVAGLYSNIENGFGPLNGTISKYAGLYADELSKTSALASDTAFLGDNLNADDTKVSEVWKLLYKYIYQANAIIEGLAGANGVSKEAREVYTGEAKFLRALNYFYLVNLFGNVPLVTMTDAQQSAVLPRARETAVYAQMIADLRDAGTALQSSFGRSDSLSSNRIRATQWAAGALLARVYLYQKNWSDAETKSSAVINSGRFNLADSLNTAFLTSSNETILQFQPAGSLYNSGEGGLFLPLGPGLKPPYPVSTSLLNSFETGDARKLYWLKAVTVAGQLYYYPYKYKVYQGGPPFTEYNIVLRLSEQFLVRAEARAQMGRLAEATDDLNTIRRKANLNPLPGSLTQQQVLQAIERERQAELFAEWGHRWFDLKRCPSQVFPTDTTLKRADDILITKTTSWQPYKKYWPIPTTEIIQNSTLVQNVGYE